jgi:hypothetical protein
MPAPTEEKQEEEMFNARVRSIYGTIIPGLCVLDVKEQNIKLFHITGDNSIIKNDLEAILEPQETATVLIAMTNAGLEDAWRIRRELISFKKLCLHLFDDAKSTEKALRQMSTFFYGDGSHGVDPATGRDLPYPHSERYNATSAEMQRCKGTATALVDARNATASICKMDRHPAAQRSARLGKLPASLEMHRAITHAQRCLAPHLAREGDEAEAEDGPLAGVGVFENPGGVGCADLVEEITRAEAGLRPCVVPFVSQLLIARGAAKALNIRVELSAYRASLRLLLSASAVTEAALDAVTVSLEAKEEGRGGLPEAGVEAAVHARKHASLLRGASSVARAVLGGLDRIAEPEVPGERLFVAGDGCKGTCTPWAPREMQGGAVLGGHKAVLGRYRDELDAEIKSLSWPWDPSLKRGDLAGRSQCKRCVDSFNELWINRGVCMRCEEEIRQDGVCPGGSKKTGPCPLVCPHSGRCFVCDEWSCEECRLHRGDGDEVANLVERLQPEFLFLDFDRTLASTKGGASPLQGNHSADPDLIALALSTVCQVHVVTRNSHTEAIREFLGRYQVDVPIHSVGKQGKGAKAGVIIGLMQGESQRGGGALFVDDDVREHASPALQGCPGLHRVLFARTA